MNDHARSETDHAECEFVNEQYHGMQYVCEDCGRVEEFDGLPVKIRSPIRDEAECTICRMWLVRREEYWNGDIEPDEVECHVCV